MVGADSVTGSTGVGAGATGALGFFVDVVAFTGVVGAAVTSEEFSVGVGISFLCLVNKMMPPTTTIMATTGISVFDIMSTII